jgi:hypothetical protein
MLCFKGKVTIKKKYCFFNPDLSLQRCSPLEIYLNDISMLEYCSDKAFFVRKSIDIKQNILKNTNELNGLCKLDPDKNHLFIW